MSDGDYELRELTELFQKLGAREPGSWAKSQIEEGIPQLLRYLFLRAAWRTVLDEDDDEWIDAEIERAAREPWAPCSGSGLALNRLLASGADRSDLTELVRNMQYVTLFRLCYLLGDPGDLEPEVEDVWWHLFEVDEDGRPLQPIGMLHESLLETDPTGREMRPRDRPG